MFYIICLKLIYGGGTFFWICPTVIPSYLLLHCNSIFIMSVFWLSETSPFYEIFKCLTFLTVNVIYFWLSKKANRLIHRMYLKVTIFKVKIGGRLIHQSRLIQPENMVLNGHVTYVTMMALELHENRGPVFFVINWWITFLKFPLLSLLHLWSNIICYRSFSYFSSITFMYCIFWFQRIQTVSQLSWSICCFYGISNQSYIEIKMVPTLFLVLSIPTKKVTLASSNAVTRYRWYTVRVDFKNLYKYINNIFVK